MGAIALHELYRRAVARAYAIAARTDLPAIGRAVTMEPSARMLGTRNIRVGERSNISALVRLETHDDGLIDIGERTWIGPGVVMSAHAPLTVGDDVLIASYCHVLTERHDFEAEGPIRGQRYTGEAPVEIRDGAWVGAGAVVMPGVTIGSGSVVGANSVVMIDVPDSHVAAGAPARIVRSIDRRLAAG